MVIIIINNMCDYSGPNGHQLAVSAPRVPPFRQCTALSSLSCGLWVSHDSLTEGQLTHQKEYCRTHSWNLEGRFLECCPFIFSTFWDYVEILKVFPLSTLSENFFFLLILLNVLIFVFEDLGAISIIGNTDFETKTSFSTLCTGNYP